MIYENVFFQEETFFRFQPIFYKIFLDDVGDDVWNFVKQTFDSGNFDPQVAETLVVLIPKVDNPKHFRDFRPINLCNVLYKLISKVLVNRMKPLLNPSVSPLQNSFIPGRGTSDNGIILQKVIHSFSKNKKKKGDVLFKFDLDKTYDKVECSFLKQVLFDFGFPEPTINLMFCVSSLVTFLLWNGIKTTLFPNRRGLH